MAQNERTSSGWSKYFPAISMIAFFTCFVLAALVSQVYSGIHPTEDHSPLDYFTGGALWMASVVCLLMALAYAPNMWRMAFWLAGAAALSVLAIDEFMAVHEATKAVVGDDDHSKVFLWLAAPILLAVIARVENASTTVKLFFVAGFVFHTIYLMADIGDGDYFTLPFPLIVLQYTEDISELLFVTTYLLGFLNLHGAKLRLVNA